jgi:hypothetical protein
VGWTLLLPMAWRRRMARTLLRRRWPSVIASRLERRAGIDPLDGCGRCEHCPTPPSAAPTIRVVKRARR